MTTDPTPTTSTGSPEVVLHEQQLRVTTRRVPTERVVLRRRVVTETRQIEVTVRREELEVHRLPLDTDDMAPATATERRLVIVLSQEVPVVDLRTQPYEKVTVHIDRVAGQQQITETIAAEHADVTTHPVDP